jgi:predicted nucleic acid-binding protein
MNFWDSSAIVPLLVEEPATESVMELYRRDPAILSWWGTEIECVSALSRAEREDSRMAPIVDNALLRLNTLRPSWHEVQPVSLVRQTAYRLLRVHPLRAADALQLAAAIVASENRPSNLGFVCLDRRLFNAAKREGFTILPTPDATSSKTGKSGNPRKPRKPGDGG